eukprot:COSAG01_NODE_18669_length_1061_cov_1.030146_1_plen_37_part_10
MMTLRKRASSEKTRTSSLVIPLPPRKILKKCYYHPEL